MIGACSIRLLAHPIMLSEFAVQSATIEQCGDLAGVRLRIRRLGVRVPSGARKIVEGLSCSDAGRALRRFCPVWTLGVTWVPHGCRHFPWRLALRWARDLRLFRDRAGRFSE